MMADARGVNQAPCFKDVRLVLDSAPSDSELKDKVQAVAEELQAIDEALDDKGSYLGIVNKEKLRTRKWTLGQRISLLKEERRMLQSLRASLKVEKERSEAERKGYVVSLPRQGRAMREGGAKPTVAHAPPPAVGRTLASKPKHARGISLNLTPPPAARAGIGEFLKANANIGISYSGRPPNPKRIRLTDTRTGDRGMVDADNDVIMS